MVGEPVVAQVSPVAPEPIRSDSSPPDVNREGGAEPKRHPLHTLPVCAADESQGIEVASQEGESGRRLFIVQGPGSLYACSGYASIILVMFILRIAIHEFRFTL
ncbi:hypothetical protein KIPB_012923, partial [Kipferlia bialata]|eukprot:g12923.t1